MAEAVPDDVRDFILRYVDSVAQLEALLLLRANPEKSWEPASAASRLYIAEAEIGLVLARLHGDGLVSVGNEGYRYNPASAEQRELIDRLADAYVRHLIPVTNIIHAKPRRIREFADAFKIRKDT
jgi:hypothetical protein